MTNNKPKRNNTITIIVREKIDAKNQEAVKTFLYQPFLQKLQHYGQLFWLVCAQQQTEGVPSEKTLPYHCSMQCFGFQWPVFYNSIITVRTREMTVGNWHSLLLISSLCYQTSSVFWFVPWHIDPKCKMHSGIYRTPPRLFPVALKFVVFINLHMGRFAQFSTVKEKIWKMVI